MHSVNKIPKDICSSIVLRIWTLQGKHNSGNSNYGCSHRTQWNTVVQQTKNSQKNIVQKCVIITKEFE